MVKGLHRFREHFKAFTDRYVLIGGTACDLAFTAAVDQRDQADSCCVVASAFPEDSCTTGTDMRWLRRLRGVDGRQKSTPRTHPPSRALTVTSGIRLHSGHGSRLVQPHCRYIQTLVKSPTLSRSRSIQK